MDLRIRDRLFIVTGASSGFGRAVSGRLSEEGARVIALARGQDRLDELSRDYPGIETHAMDITLPGSLKNLEDIIRQRELSGIVVNAGGPPAKSFLETDMADWDEAYRSILRWKVELTKFILPYFEGKNFGRYLYIESVSVKQPIPNLVLSNSLRMGVTGFVKTFSDEIAGKGITANVMAPGYHMTPALERVIAKNSRESGESPEDTLQKMLKNVPVGRAGGLEDFASLAAWILSPFSSYITGQTISVDGGSVKGSMG